MGVMGAKISSLKTGCRVIKVSPHYDRFLIDIKSRVIKYSIFCNFQCNISWLTVGFQSLQKLVFDTGSQVFIHNWFWIYMKFLLLFSNFFFNFCVSNFPIIPRVDHIRVFNLVWIRIDEVTSWYWNT
jgi:hypothetical protein